MRSGRFAHPVLTLVFLAITYALTLGGKDESAELAEAAMGGPVQTAAANMGDMPSRAPEGQAALTNESDVDPDSSGRPGASVDAEDGGGAPMDERASASSNVTEPPEADGIGGPIGRLLPMPGRISSPVRSPVPPPQEAEPPDDAPEPLREPIVQHVVKSGENLTVIARSYGIDVNTIIAANELVDADRIRPGDTLNILNQRGALHVVQSGDNLSKIAQTYEVSVQSIIEANQLENPHALRVNQRLIIPGAQDLVAQWRSNILVSSSGQLLRNFSWPVRGRISSRFGPRSGRMHEGVDIAVPIGTPIVAAAPGRVTFAGHAGTYGLLVVIDHGRGVETRYAHNSRLLVQAGQRVAREQRIALSGNTGRSTGPHLHFEIRLNSRPVDPIRYLR